jgi:hypothetical protein
MAVEIHQMKICSLQSDADILQDAGRGDIAGQQLPDVITVISISVELLAEANQGVDRPLVGDLEGDVRVSFLSFPSC